VEGNYREEEASRANIPTITGTSLRGLGYVYHSLNPRCRLLENPKFINTIKKVLCRSDSGTPLSMILSQQTPHILSLETDSSGALHSVSLKFVSVIVSSWGFQFCEFPNSV
jgi:hypothetical protein